MLLELNVSENRELKELNCSFNHLQILDVSANRKLVYLDCNNNHLKLELNLSTNRALEYLDCSNNALSYLNTDINSLKYLICSQNMLTELDINKNRALVYLQCGNNNISFLDVTTNTELQHLYCQNNSIKDLDTSTNRRLATIVCNNNYINSLRVSDASVYYICTYNNRILLSDLYVASMHSPFQNDAFLGLQTLETQVTEVGEEIDFSAEATFSGDGVATVFAVKKNGEDAVIDVDYSINNGIIIFHTEGSYCNHDKR
jgi:Leucine-rich repeat (LRR) protein